MLPRGTAGALRPVAVSLDPATGELCVTDARQPALHVINPAGVAVFRTSRMSRLNTPLDGCLDPDGAFVFIDKAQAGGALTLRKLNLFGEPLDFAAEAPSTDWAPHHLALAADGNYLVLDQDDALLSKHDRVTGKVLWQASVIDDHDADVFLGRPVEGPDGRIFVPGGELHSVLVLSPEGELLDNFGRFGTGPGKLVFPVGVAFGPEGTVLVLDRMRHKILIYGPDFEYLAEFGSMGGAPGQFYHPIGITSSPDGLVHVAQGFEGRVQAFQISR